VKTQIELTEEIIETAYRLLIHKLANGGLTSKNESSFQLEFGYALKTLGHLYEFRPEDKFHLELESYLPLAGQSIKSKSDRARVDLLIDYRDDKQSVKAAIELKFFKKENHREPNNRYDVFKDLSNLELYKQNNIDLCYFILATDHLHYVSQDKYSPDTADFDFRNGKEYNAGTILSYRTATPYGDNLQLKQNYKFAWDNVRELNFLKVKV
jgi:hypothetical protein